MYNHVHVSFNDAVTTPTTETVSVWSESRESCPYDGRNPRGLFVSGSCCGNSPPGGRHALLTPRDLLAAGRVLGRSCRLTWLLWKRGNASADSFPKHWPSCASRIHRPVGSSGTSGTFQCLQTKSKLWNRAAWRNKVVCHEICHWNQMSLLSGSRGLSSAQKPFV
jgi:hypothetical protein